MCPRAMRLRRGFASNRGDSAFRPQLELDAPVSPRSRPLAVALRGLKGSGKSAVARALAASLDWPLIVTGDVVRQWAVAANSIADPETVRRVAEKARKTPHGVMGQILRTVWPNTGFPTNLIVDCVREADDVTSLQAVGYSVVLVTVSAPFETRLRRMLKRSRSDDIPSRNALRVQDRWERQLGRGGVRGDGAINLRSDRLDRLVRRVLRRLRHSGAIDA